MSPGEPAFEPSIVTATVIPEHELVRPIASGAYGQVWLARNSLGKFRAVKIVHRANFDHDRPFEREFAGIKSFEPISRSHEGLVNLLQVGRENAAGYFYYVMELADDISAEGTVADAESALHCSVSDPESYAPRTLASELKRHGRLSLQECVRIGLSLARALAYLHRQGLVHRDIKPSNIIFVGGVPKLADVGLVAGVGEARSFVGTEGFIPPEGPGTPPADLYSLGIVLYVLSTGKSHQDFPEPLADLAAEPDHARWLEFNAILHKACQAKASERYQTAEEMCAELELLERGESVKEKRAVQKRRVAAKKVGLPAVLLALLAMLLLGLNAARGHRPTAEAARLYGFGRWHYNQMTSEDHAKALDYLTRAVKADPKFVQPYSELIGLYIWALLPGITNDQQRFQPTKAIADQLMAMGPDVAEGHQALSLCKFLERDWRGAEAEILRAIHLNPKLPIPHQFYSFYLTMLDRTEEARRESQRAEELEPPDAARVSAIVSAWPYMAERRFDLAITQLQKVIDLDRNFSPGHNFLGMCYEAQSNYVAAIEAWRLADSLVLRDEARVTASYDALRQAFETQGEQGYFRKWIELSATEESLPEDKKMFSQRDLADCYAMLGEKDKALEIIEEHFDEPGVWHQIKFKPLYKNLYGDPRYEALVRRAGLQP